MAIMMMKNHHGIIFPSIFYGHFCLRVVLLLWLSINTINANANTTTGSGIVPDDTPENISLSSPIVTSCHSLVVESEKGWNKRLLKIWHRRRRQRQPILAYRMMVVSILSYWEFGKRPLPNHITGFSLSIDTSRILLPLLGRTRLRRYHIRRVMSWICKILEQATLTGHVDMYRTRKSSNSTTGTIMAQSIHSLHPLSSVDSTHPTRITLQYYFFNWHEKGVAGVRFHDTDVLVSTMDDGSLVIGFAGTASAADAVTNLQTFEPTNHSGFYTNVQGSLHRGFLNALTRVDRGLVLRLCPHCHNTPDYLNGLLSVFGNCTRTSNTTNTKFTSSKNNKDSTINKVLIENSSSSSSSSSSSNQTNIPTNPSFTSQRRRKGGCKVQGKGLLSILEEITIQALQQGQTVHLTGHSLGGGLASHMALNLILNAPTVSIKKLHLWTFGAPQIVDSIFLSSAMQIAGPRLFHFVSGRNAHRYVTVSDNCLPDVVSEVTKLSLPSHKLKGLHGKMARKLGGVHGPIVHFTSEPHYLLTPQQFQTITTSSSSSWSSSSTTTNTNTNTNTNTTKTHSTVAAHSTVNYLHGISRESRHHPLQTDLPDPIRQWLGECNIQR